MTAQRRYEYAIDARMDKDLSETIAAACCENCGRELVDDKCEKCDSKMDEDEIKAR